MPDSETTKYYSRNPGLMYLAAVGAREMYLAGCIFTVGDEINIAT
jgi:hypothetical protein